MSTLYRNCNAFGTFPEESKFLIKLAVDRYNRQHNQKFDIDSFELTSIRPRTDYDLGYLIETKRKDDYLRLKIYLNIDKATKLHNFMPEVDQGHFEPMTLEDEVLVAFGTVDSWYRQEGIYKFMPINNEEMLVEYIALENGRAILLENGEVLALE